jgi:hypothetical protein
VVKLHGENHWLVKNDPRQGFFVTLPEDVRESFFMGMREGMPEDQAALLADFKADFESGTIARLEAWNRGERENGHAKEFTQAAEEAQKVCQNKFKAQIDWKSVSDDMLKEKYIASFCTPVVDAMKTLCERFPESRAELKDLTEVRCSLDGKAGIKRDGNTLSWTPGDVNIDQQAWTELAIVTERNPTVLKSGNNYVVMDATNTEKPLYFGDGKKFIKHRLLNESSSVTTWYLFNGGHPAELKGGDGQWVLECGDKKAATFTELPLAERKQVLAGASFGDYTFDRVPFSLARDDKGTYYYVDQRLPELGGKGFQVHVGKVGAVTTTDLKDIVDDSQGMIFSTKKGNLRLIVKAGTTKEAYWIVGTKKPEALTSLDIWRSHGLIFEKLGVYDRVDLGTMCEKF